ARQFAINAIGIDSGKFTDEVYTAVRRLAMASVPHVYAVKGQGINKTAMRTPWSLTVIDKWPNGDPMPGGCRLLNINSDLWKTRVVSRMKSTPEEEDVPHLAPGQIPGFYLPENTGGSLEEYLEFVTAEQ